jgi:2-polyprenyl-6-methoxyphenol hydroxylase-like FAD-dependent oxidoreductase
MTASTCAAKDGLSTSRSPELTNRHVTIYGQQEVVKDLIAARLDRGGELHFEVVNVAVHDFDTRRPRITCTLGGSAHELGWDFIAGCDGFMASAARRFPTAFSRGTSSCIPSSERGSSPKPLRPPTS